MTHAFMTQGAQLQRGNGATPTEVFALIVEVHTLTGPSEKGKAVDVSNLDSAAREFRAGLVDPGEIKTSGNWIPNAVVQQNIRSDMLNGTVRNFRLVFNDNATTPTTATFQGIVTEFSIKGGVDKQLEADIAIKITGLVSYAFNSGVTP